MQNKSPLATVCTIQNLFCSNYYSNTYRAQLQFNGSVRLFQITHISIPFAPLKERELMARFGLERDQLDTYYTQFGKCVQNAIGILNHLADKQIPGTVQLVSYDIVKKEGRGSDIYLVTEPMEPYSMAVNLYAGGTVKLTDLLALATRMVQTIKSLGEEGIRIGVLDADDIYVVQDEKPLIVLGGFLYASDASKPWNGLPIAHPAHAHIEVVNGERPSLATDVYSVLSLLSTLLQGNHYTTQPTHNGSLKYTKPELEECICAGMDEDNVYLSDEEFLPILKTVNKGLHSYVKKVKSEPGYADASITFAQPLYNMAQAHGIRAGTKMPT